MLLSEGQMSDYKGAALMLPAMLPPPTPFKAVVLAAAAFEMSFSRFLLAIFAGRFFRFLILGYLTLHFGPQVVQMGGRVIAHGFKWVLLALAAGALVWVIGRRRRANKTGAEQSGDGNKSPKLGSEEQ